MAADRVPPEGPRHGLADDLARLIGELHAIEVPGRGAPRRGADLVPRPAPERRGRQLPSVRGGLPELDGLDLDLDAAVRVWDQVLEAARDADPAPSWYHGDLLAENLLVRDGRLSAVLDFGTLGVGDPSVDLVAAWEVLDPESRVTFRRAVDVDDATWQRAMGWALYIAFVTFPYYWDTMPARCADRRAMARAVLATG